MLPCYVHIMTQFKKDTDHFCFYFLSCICLCRTLCIVTYFLHKVPFFHCLFIIVCIIFLFVCFLSLLLKEPAFINQRNEIPLCTATACLRRKQFTSTITLWLLALLVFNFFFFLLCSNLFVKELSNKSLCFSLSALMLVSQSWPMYM